MRILKLTSYFTLNLGGHVTACVRSFVRSFVHSFVRSFVRFRSFDFVPKVRRTRELAAELTGDCDGSSANSSLVRCILRAVSSAKFLTVHYMKVYNGFFIFSFINRKKVFLCRSWPYEANNGAVKMAPKQKYFYFR